MRSYLLWTEGLFTGCPHCLNDVLNPTLNEATERVGRERELCNNIKFYALLHIMHTNSGFKPYRNTTKVILYV